MLFHYQLGLPKIINTNFGIMTLNYGKHSLKESILDKYGKINFTINIRYFKSKSN